MHTITPPTVRPVPALASRGRPARLVLIGLAVVTAVTSLAFADTDTVDAQTSGPSTSAFSPIEPCRLVDTRVPGAPVDRAAGRITIDVSECDVPTDATALAITTTIISPSQRGWLVVHPSTSPAPLAATLNWEPGITRANGSIVPIGTEGTIVVQVSRPLFGANVAVDVTGAFVPASTATAGRFVPLDTAARAFDSREFRTSPLPAGSITTVPLDELVPPDASAVAVTLTAIRTRGRGFVAAYASGATKPSTSVLNSDGVGQFRAGTAIIPISPDGLDVEISVGMHLTVDVVGWFTGESAEESADGLFVPLVPRRLRDTRPETHPIHEGGAIEVGLPAGLDGGGLGVGAVAVSMTAIGADDRGWLTTFASRTRRGEVASGYTMRNELTAQFALTPVSPAGLGVFSSKGTDLTVDLLGWFTGPAAAAEFSGPPPNPVRTPRVLALGDSSMGGVRWYGAYGALRSGDWTFLGESCRKLYVPSCSVGREDRIPPSAFASLQSAPDTYDVLVIMTGYNDSVSSFTAGVQPIIDLARAKNIRRIIWLAQTRESPLDRGWGRGRAFDGHSRAIRAAVAANVDVEVAEWPAVTRQAPHWLWEDGVHFTQDGSWGNADFLSRAVAHVTGQSCAVPYLDAQGRVIPSPGGVCQDPGVMPAQDVRGIYGYEVTIQQCWEIGPNRTPSCRPDPYA